MSPCLHVFNNADRTLNIKISCNEETQAEEFLDSPGVKEETTKDNHCNETQDTENDTMGMQISSQMNDEYQNMYEPEMQGTGTGGQGQQGQVCPVQINQEQEIETENINIDNNNQEEENKDRYDLVHCSEDGSVVSSESRQSF